MDAYRTEEEQMEALRRWWQENGRSIVIAVVVALAASFGWQGWQSSRQASFTEASDLYQEMLQVVSVGEEGQAATIGERLKSEFKSSTYAQFAALHLAALAVGRNDLAEAEAQLRWVLGKASAGSDTALVAQLRLARVVAAAGDTDQALSLLDREDGHYQSAYAAARGDILLAAGRRDDALAAYNEAVALAASTGVPANTVALQQKLQALSPVPPRELDASSVDSPGVDSPGVDSPGVDSAAVDTAPAATDTDPEG